LCRFNPTRRYALRWAGLYKAFSLKMRKQKWAKVNFCPFFVWFVALQMRQNGRFQE